MSNLVPISDDFELTEEQYETIQTLAACNFSITQIAVYLCINKDKLQQAYEDPLSRVRHHYDKGILISEFEINNELVKNARGGNITASQVFDKNRRKRLFENHRDRILNED